MTHDPATSAADPVIEVAGLWKIFGDQADTGRLMARDGASRAEIQ